MLDDVPRIILHKLTHVVVSDQDLDEKTPSRRIIRECY
jgi:hypothetical protein